MVLLMHCFNIKRSCVRLHKVTVIHEIDRTILKHLLKFLISRRREERKHEAYDKRFYCLCVIKGIQV